VNLPLRVAVDHLREGVQIIGPDWRYLYLNAAATQHGQCPAEDLLDRTMMECYPGIEDTEVFRSLARVMETRRSETFQNEFVFPSGERRVFDLFIEPVPDGICVLSLDVTDRHRAEAELRRVQQEANDQRQRVFRATMNTVQNIMNNLLNNLQFVRLEAEAHLSAETLALFDQMIADGAEKVKSLADMHTVTEREMSIGPGIDFPERTR
jgi:hypothetical protein